MFINTETDYTPSGVKRFRQNVVSFFVWARLFIPETFRLILQTIWNKHKVHENVTPRMNRKHIRTIIGSPRLLGRSHPRGGEKIK